MERDITDYIKKSIIYLKNNSYNKYLKKFSFDKTKAEVFFKKVNIRSSYSFLENQRNHAYSIFESQIKKNQFNFSDIQIKKITIREQIINNYKVHRAVILISTGSQEAIIEINCITVFDDGTIFSDGELNLKIFRAKKRKKQYLQKTFGSLFDSLKKLKKAANDIEIEWDKSCIHKTAGKLDITESESKLDVKFPNELTDFWVNYTNGNGKSVHEYTNNFGLELFSHQKIVRIADFFQWFWANKLYEEINIFEVDDGITLTQKEKNIVLKVNNEFFVFAVEWSDEYHSLAFLVFDRDHNIYLMAIDTEMSPYSHLKAVKSNILLTESNFDEFFTKYVNIEIARYESEL